jgi:hypothetical protein
MRGGRQGPRFAREMRNCSAKPEKLNRKDLEDRKEKILRGLCGLCGANSD